MCLLVPSDTESMNAPKTRLVVLVQPSVTCAQHMILAQLVKREPSCNRVFVLRTVKLDGQLTQLILTVNHAWTSPTRTNVSRNVQLEPTTVTKHVWDVMHHA